MTRSSMIDVLRQDYIRTAKAKGANKLGENKIKNKIKNFFINSSYHKKLYYNYIVIVYKKMKEYL